MNDVTPKEAVEILRNYHNGYFGYKIDDVKKAHNLAITALVTSSTRPSGDLISREALKKYARVVFDKDLGRLRVVDVSDIDNAPTVDVTALCPLDFPTADDPYPCCSYKRPRGEWIVIHNALGETKYQCDQCQHYVKPSDDKNFCPNCGADMRKGGAE